MPHTRSLILSSIAIDKTRFFSSFMSSGPPPNPSRPTPYTSSSSLKIRLPLSLPPPVHSMPPTTTADRNRVERSFRKQYDRVSDDIDAVMAADEGPARKQAIVQLLESLVSPLTFHRSRRTD
jgi:hypothetical protein